MTEQTGKLELSDEQEVRKKRKEIEKIALANLSDRALLPPIGSRQALMFCAIDDHKGHAYAAQIVDWLRTRLGGGVNPGQVYATLASLVESGFLETEGHHVGENRRVIFYNLTKKGRTIFYDSLSPYVRMNHAPSEYEE